MNELSTLNKIFSATIAVRLAGKTTNTKFQGSQQEIAAITEAITASENFHNELNRPEATIKSVMSKLGEKHISVANFEKILGVPWPL